MIALYLENAIIFACKAKGQIEAITNELGFVRSDHLWPVTTSAEFTIVLRCA